MPMTTEQTEAVLKWVERFKSKCPVCQTEGPSHYFNEFFTLSQAVPGGAKTRSSEPRFFGLTCRSCGFLWLVDAIVARIPNDPK
jgi:hypothetical protein